MKLITDYFFKTAEIFKNKVAVIDQDGEKTYGTLSVNTKRIGSALLKGGINRKPIAIYMNKNSGCLESMLGVGCSGNFYTVIDPEMPAKRIETIFSVLNPVAVITEDAKREDTEKLPFKGKVFIYEDIITEQADDRLLSEANSKAVDTDLLYCLFTSGSTGVPKGTAVTHSNVIAYSKWAADTFSINSETVLGNQTPFYFSMSVTDIFTTVRTGATLVILPKAYFSFPVKLTEFMNKTKVNTIYWVPSALCIVANMDLFKYVRFEHLKQVMFAGEVMPVKQLNYWIKHYPDIPFSNLYGPTETTDICTYYTVNRPFSDDSSLPIGVHCDNCDVFVVDEKGNECEPQAEGELYVRGPFVAPGYYGNKEKTDAAFVQNPLNPYYPEKVYKTGDIVKYNDLGELIYIGRKDFQIKHMGYRIELGEIEASVSSLDGVRTIASVYDKDDDRIVLIYEGKIKQDEIREKAAKKLPVYMMPSMFIKVPSMPLNSSGKIDRSYLKNNYKTLIKE